MVFLPNPTIPSDGSNEMFPRFNTWCKANPELAQEFNRIHRELLVTARVEFLDENKVLYEKINDPNTKFAVIATIITILVIGIIFISGFLLGRFL